MDNTEELSPEEAPEETPEETPEGESSEEKEPEEPSEEGEDKTPPKTEYTKERFDGLMGAWQTDRKRLLAIEEENRKLRETGQPAEQQTKEDKWVDYMDTKIEEKRKAREAKQDEEAKRELEDVSVKYPDLNRDDVLNTAIKYNTNLSTAASILEDVRTGKDLSAAEAEKKKQASTIGGKPGAVPKPELTPYDPKLSMRENIDKGRKEIGS